MKQFVLFDWAAMPLPASARHCQATKKYKKIIPRNYIPASSTSAGRPARADLPPPFPNGISRRRWPSEMLFFRQSRESDANSGRSFNKTFVEIYYLKWGGVAPCLSRFIYILRSRVPIPSTPYIVNFVLHLSLC